MATATIKVTGNTTEAVAALERLGIKAEETGAKAESKLSQASEIISGAFRRIGEAAERAGLEVGAGFSAMGEKMEATEAKSKGISSSLSGFGTVLGLGVAAGALALAKFSVGAEEAGQVADTNLRNAVENVGGSFEELEPKIQAADAAGRQFGFTNVDLNNALATMTRGLHDPQKALSDLGVAEDVARAKHIDLATASMAVTKAAEGQLRPLKQLGIDLPVAAGGAKAVAAAQTQVTDSTQKLNTFLAAHADAVNTSSKYHLTYEQMLDKVHAAQAKLSAAQQTGSQIMAAVEQVTKNAAAAYGDTYAGKMAAARAQADNLGEQLGTVLLPAMTDVMGAVDNSIVFFQQHEQVAGALAVVIGGALASVAVVKAVNGVKEMATQFRAAASVASDLGSAVASKAASGLDTFSTGAKAAGSFVADLSGKMVTGIAQTAEYVAAKVAAGATLIATNVAEAAAATAAFIAENAATLGIVAAIGLLVAAAIYVGTHWSQVWGDIQDVAKAAWSFLSPIFSFIGNAIKDYVLLNITILRDTWNVAWDAISSAAQAAWSVLGPVFSWIGNAAKTYVGDQVQAVEIIWNGVWSGITSAVEDAWGFLQPILAKISGAVSSVVSDVQSVGSTLSSLGGGVLSHIPGFASGGVTPANQPFWVGENGPELMISNTTNAVIPNSMLGGIMSPMGGSSPSSSGRGSGPLISIGQFIAGGQSADDIASGLAFDLRGAGA